MNMKPFLLAAALLLAATSLQAQLLVNLSPSASSKVEDHFSNAYARFGLSPQGMYDLTTNNPYGPSNPFTPGPWNGIATLALSGTPTLTGTENFTITGASGFGFGSVINGEAFSILGAYQTSSLSGISGTVTLVNGTVTTLSFNATIAFVFNNAPGMPYVGTITLTETGFDLLVDDDSVDFGAGPVRQVWNVDGAASIGVIPEPSTYALLGLGLAALAWMRRRARAWSV